MLNLIRLRRKQGHTMPSIAAELNVSINYIWRMCKKYGYGSGRIDEWKEHEIQALVVQWNEGRYVEEIADSLHKSVAAVRQRIFILRRKGYDLISR